MALFQSFRLDENACLCAIWKVEESEEQLTAPLPHGNALLAEARTRFSAPSRRLEWLAVRRLLHEVGCLSPIAYLPSGRPYLAEDNRHLSISHTRGYVAVALHDTRPVGLDIEQRGVKVCRVQEKFLSREEKLFLPSEKKNVEALHLIWSAKEAMFKLIDREGIDFAEHLHLHPFSLPSSFASDLSSSAFSSPSPSPSDTLSGEFSAWETFTEENRAFRFHYRLFPDFVFVCGVEK